ncbi:MAG TPA: thiolase domain-containing protein [Myxococcota bacterium]|nr:thiolase domain-containing protein [Myxococcota bacterium]
MRDVAIVSFAQSTKARELRNEIEILMPVVREAVSASRLPRSEIGFTCSGSSDYLQGQSFAFVGALDAVGAWPPIRESHVEMDGAWALYEAWIKIQTGDVDSALVYSFGKSSPGDIAEVLALQLDPYTVTPLWPDADSLAAIQARAFLEATGKSERELAEVVARSRRNAIANPHAVVSGEFDVEKLLLEPYVSSPLRAHDLPPVTDGASALVLVAGERARQLCSRPVWIRGIDHRIEPQSLGARPLVRSESTEIAGQKAGVHKGKVDFAELHAPYSHQELILRAALGLGDGVEINPSGGALASHPLMAAGLVRIGEAAIRIMAGHGNRAVAHATQGPCLQQNLVCVLEGD